MCVCIYACVCARVSRCVFRRIRYLYARVTCADPQVRNTGPGSRPRRGYTLANAGTPVAAFPGEDGRFSRNKFAAALVGSAARVKWGIRDPRINGTR